MARYIDVDKHSFPTLHQKELNDYMKGWNTCLKSVLQQPTADAVEVVRCRECRHCNHLHDEFDNDWYFCTLTINNAEVQGDWYCCRGERRTDNDV